VKGKFPKVFKLAMALALVVGLVPVLAVPALAAGPTVSAFTASPLTAGSTAQYTVNVSVLAGNTSADTVSITFPSGFTVPSSIAASYISFGGQPLGAAPVVDGLKVTFLLPDSDGTGGWTTWAANNYPVVISQLAGIKNPSVGVYRYRLTIAMSQYADTTNSNYIVIYRTASRSPSSGVRGTTTTVTGAGFTSATTANIVMGIAGTNDVLNAAGLQLVETFTAPDSFVARGVVVGNIVRNISDGSYMVVTSFATTVTANDTLVATTALTGGGRTTIGNTWQVGDLYAVELTGPSLGSGTVGSDGTFTATVTASGTGFVAGSNTLVATDGAGRSATFSFSINASVTLNPTSGKAGAAVTVAARDFAGANIPANSTTVAGVAVTHAGVVLQAGAGSFTFNIPAGLAGTKSVVVTDNAANTASTTLTLLGSPLTASPASGVIGTRVTISGTGFTANGTIPQNQLVFGGAAWNTGVAPYPGAITIDSGGNFLVAVPLTGAVENVASTGGTYTITALDSGTLSGAVNFTVPVASITLSTASSVVGSSVVVRGVGFPANSVAIVSYAGTPVGTGIVDSTGNFAAAISVPSTAQIPSTNTISATATSAAGTAVPPAATPATATHSVPSAAITLSATSGNPGSSLRITGTGFPAYAVVANLTIGNIPAMPSPAPATDGNGNITANTIVPSLPTGPAVVAVTIGAVTGSTAYTVTSAATTPGVALAGIAGSYTRVWGYDSAAKAWKLYDPANLAISDLTVLTRGQGYWISCTQAATLVYGANQYVLNVGWNLIGWLD